MNAPHATLPVNPHPEPDPDGPQPFAGLTVLVTGEVPGLSRSAAQDAISRLGGKPVASVSSKTGLVVVGDGAGVSKMAKVRLHQTRVLPGDAFAALAADPASWDGTEPGMPVADYDAQAPAAAEDTDDEPARSADHLVTQAVVYPRLDGRIVQQVRCTCTCGHRWLGLSVHENTRGCPVDTGRIDVPVTVAPWEHPAPAPRTPAVPTPPAGPGPALTGDWPFA